MKYLFLATIILILPVSTQAEYDGNEASIEWLSWPIIATPYDGYDSELMFPSGAGFSLDVRRDIIIGLRSDGTVVWKSLKSDIEDSENR